MGSTEVNAPEMWAVLYFTTVTLYMYTFDVTI